MYYISCGDSQHLAIYGCSYQYKIKKSWLLMKFKRILFATASFVLLFGVADSMAQKPPCCNDGNPGIAISGSQNYSQLPEKSRMFIEKYFKSLNVKSCKKYFAKDTYEVELSNGIDIDFNANGDVVEMDAPDNFVFPVDAVKDVIPEKAYNRLVKDGYNTMVESIDFKDGRVYEIELNVSGPDTYLFDVDGKFLTIDD